MVRTLLVLLAASALLSGCSKPTSSSSAGASASASDPAAAAAGANAHANVACAACHSGPKADVGQAPVPREACTASGCHADAGPPQVTLATARFDHRNHGVDSKIAVSCAGCHTHNSGEAPLRASLDACALCHTRSLAGKKEDDCRLCHTSPKHTSFTSQGIPVAHAALPFLETGCARCHYDVLGPVKKVSMQTCANCHTKNPDATTQGIAQDLHPNHRGVQCTSCHQAGLHRIGAMSSAVNLQCADCHDRAHGQAVTITSVRTCNDCHTTTHAAQQRLLLGFVGNEPVLPSAKFLLGLTCRSCHVPPGTSAVPVAENKPRRGQAAACKACHEQEFGEVLDWWIDGVRGREETVSTYVTAAQRALPNAPDSSRALLASAHDMLALVREAGGQHNLELSDLIFRSSVDNVTNAYRLAGRIAPPPPQLGNTPHVGTCSFCHYGANERWNYNGIPLALHERLIKTRK